MNFDFPAIVSSAVQTRKPVARGITLFSINMLALRVAARIKPTGANVVVDILTLHLYFTFPEKSVTVAAFYMCKLSFPFWAITLTCFRSTSVEVVDSSLFVHGVAIRTVGWLVPV